MNNEKKISATNYVSKNIEKSSTEGLQPVKMRRWVLEQVRRHEFFALQAMM